MIITTTFDSEHWQVVPVELDARMLDAAFYAHSCFSTDSQIDDLWKALRAAAPPAPSAWLPLESAPKDGTKFIVYGHPFGFRSIWITSGTKDLDIAIRWMPLPQPPEQAGGKVES